MDIDFEEMLSASTPMQQYTTHIKVNRALTRPIFSSLFGIMTLDEEGGCCSFLHEQTSSLGMIHSFFGSGAAGGNSNV